MLPATATSCSWCLVPGSREAIIGRQDIQELGPCRTHRLSRPTEEKLRCRRPKKLETVPTLCQINEILVQGVGYPEYCI
jgi:hypothetical protein